MVWYAWTGLILLWSCLSFPHMFFHCPLISVCITALRQKPSEISKSLKGQRRRFSAQHLLNTNNDTYCSKVPSFLAVPGHKIFSSFSFVQWEGGNEWMNEWISFIWTYMRHQHYEATNGLFVSMDSSKMSPYTFADTQLHSCRIYHDQHHGSNPASITLYPRGPLTCPCSCIQEKAMWCHGDRGND